MYIPFPKRVPRALKTNQNKKWILQSKITLLTSNYHPFIDKHTDVHHTQPLEIHYVQWLVAGRWIFCNVISTLMQWHSSSVYYIKVSCPHIKCKGPLFSMILPSPLSLYLSCRSLSLEWESFLIYRVDLFYML